MKLDISPKLLLNLKKHPTHFAIYLKLFFNKTQTSFVRLNDQFGGTFSEILSFAYK